MSVDGIRRLAWVAATAALVLVAAATGLWLVEVLTGSNDQRPFYAEDAASGLAFAVVGALIVHHRPRHHLGWVLVAMGLAGALSVASAQYAYHAVVADPGSLPAPTFAAWLAVWTWLPTYGLVPLVLLLFPEPPDGWWRRLVPVTAIVTGLMVIVVAMITAADPVRYALFQDGPPDGVATIAFSALMAGFVVLVALGIASMIVRWRAADRLGRQQRKWLVATATFGIGCLVVKNVAVAVLGSVPWGMEEVLGVVGFAVLPVGIVIAVLRYRLYDIDRIVSRTVSYAVVTLVLAGIYVAGVLGVGRFVVRLTGGGSELVVAASTLAVAAAFRPVRTRVQAVVDRRFNRARYDAARTVEEFAQRLRDEVDLSSLVADLGSTVQETVGPKHASVWIPHTRSLSP